MKYCQKCLTPDTRLRVQLVSGICNACNYWFKTAREIDWEKRYEMLDEICNVYRGKGDPWDVIVGVSGGKDGSYVAYKMREDFGMNPLCVTFSPPMQTEIGRQNLENFRNKGDFDLIEIRPKPSVYKRLCKKMFTEQARCKFPFVIGIFTAVSQIALKFNIPFIMGGEQGEQIYSGDSKYDDLDFITPEFVVDVYHEGNNLRHLIGKGFTRQELSWWLLPSVKEMTRKLQFTWWSKWEAWDDQLHRDLAVDKCGLEILHDPSIGTMTHGSQIDDVLQDLHQYEMFIKYGHGRATADVNLAIHANRMTRKEAVEIVREKDGIFPDEYLQNYLDFFEMTNRQFWEVLSNHVNRDILKLGKGNKPWVLKKGVS